MFSVGEIIDNKYAVAGLCSSSGGMGTILFVNPIQGTAEKLVLKYCNQTDDETKTRFRREVRVMQQFNGNAFVAPIVDANLDYVTPYFVMPYFEHGDLLKQAALIRGDLATAEAYFNRMIDCLEQLHSKNVFHRDIKPQNFLVGNGTVVVSDLGLCTEHDSSTAFTRSSAWAGTPRYMPPEFHDGGFRNADATGDIFMLGVTFRDILSGGEQGAIPDAISVVIERACAQDKNRRYQSLAPLRQSLSMAFGVALGRVIGQSGVLGTIQSIVDRWKTTGQSDLAEIAQFIDELTLLPGIDQERVCKDLPEEIFEALSRTLLPPGQLGRFIEVYLSMAERSDYGWSFAEVIAENMSVLFDSELPSAQDKAECLRTAIIASVRQNRFAAMDTCKEMIVSIQDSGLAQRVFEIMMEHPSYFMENIDPLTCGSLVIQQAINTLKSNNAAQQASSPVINPFPL